MGMGGKSNRPNLDEGGNLISVNGWGKDKKEEDPYPSPPCSNDGGQAERDAWVATQVAQSVFSVSYYEGHTRNPDGLQHGTSGIHRKLVRADELIKIIKENGLIFAAYEGNI